MVFHNAVQPAMKKEQLPMHNGLFAQFDDSVSKYSPYLLQSNNKYLNDSVFAKGAIANDSVFVTNRYGVIMNYSEFDTES